MSTILYTAMILATFGYVIYLGWLVDELDRDNRQLSTRLRLLTFQASQSCTCSTSPGDTGPDGALGWSSTTTPDTVTFPVFVTR